VGRELVLNGQVRFAAIRQHVRSKWGDRETVDVSARAAIRTLRSMGVLQGTPGSRTVGPDCRLEVPGELASWIYHALMLTRQAAEMDLQSIHSAPELFMLRLPASLARGYPLLERVNEGGGRAVLRLGVPSAKKRPRPGQLILFEPGALNRAT
jgi:hypothetical protein